MLHLPASDQPTMTFLWRESPIKEPRVYQFQRTLFEEVSAPSRANYTMRRNADENGDPPLRVKAVYKTFYMDDGLLSTDSREEARNAETNDEITAPWKLPPAQAVNERP